MGYPHLASPPSRACSTTAGRTAPPPTRYPLTDTLARGLPAPRPGVLTTAPLRSGFAAVLQTIESAISRSDTMHEAATGTQMVAELMNRWCAASKEYDRHYPQPCPTFYASRHPIPYPNILYPPSLSHATWQIIGEAAPRPQVDWSHLGLCCQ